MEIFLLGIALVWLVFASISDLKKREVPDWLSYSLILMGFAYSILKSILFENVQFFLFSLFSFGVFFLISSLLYYTKQWGGGDVKLLTGIATLFPIYPISLLNYFSPNLNISFLLIFIINIILVGSIYTFVYGIYLLIKNKVNLLKELKKYKLNKINLFFVLVFLVLSFLKNDIILRLMFLFMGLIILITQFLFFYIKIIEEKCMFKNINVKDLTEGDWIKENIYYKGKLIYNKSSPGVTKNEIEIIKKLKIKNLIIKEGIPFIPVFLISFIITLIFGNLLNF